MIQIDEKIIIAGLLVIVFLLIVYFAYFIITKKLFPKMIEFQKEIKPNETIAISTIEGSGIIKKIEIETTENDKSSIDLIVDQTSFVILSISKKASSQDRDLKALEETLNVEINLNQKFGRSFSIFFRNTSDKASHSKGKIHYEIRQSLKNTLKAILSELH